MDTLMNLGLVELIWELKLELETYVQLAELILSWLNQVIVEWIITQKMSLTLLNDEYGRGCMWSN